MTRWVPAPERRGKPRPASTPEADVYRALASGEVSPSPGRRLLKQGVLGLTAIGLIGWLVRNTRGDQPSQRARPTAAKEPSKT